MLIPANTRDGVLESANCNRVLLIFDGQRRYNLVLAYRRLDKVNIERGYSGPVLVCGAILQPIGGYRADSMVVKYIAGRRDIELWFAPITGTSIMAPIRVLVPTLIGTLRIRAEQFKAVATSASPVPIPSNESPRESVHLTHDICWHKADKPIAPTFVRCWSNSGQRSALSVIG